MKEAPLLDLQNVTVGYGAVEVLHGVSLSIARGQIMALVGANGAGKSTLLNTISGFVSARAGTIHYDRTSIVGCRPAAIASSGLRHVPEGRRVFTELTVAENLELGGYGQPKADVAKRLERVYQLFPRLVERCWQAAGTLSGGEQQMLAIGRALSSGPKLLMLDEPSMGLAPLVVAEIFRLICQLRDEFGLGILLVEQNARAALRVADQACVLSLGRITMRGTGRQLLANPTIVEAFLGGHDKAPLMKKSPSRLA